MAQSENPNDSYVYFSKALSIQTVLQEMGYKYDPKSGKRKPAYIRTDDAGKHISGDKYIVNPIYNTAFYAGDRERKNYNVISLIKDHPYDFKDYVPGMKPSYLANIVSRRLLGIPNEIREANVVKSPSYHPFDMDDYDIVHFDKRMVAFPKDGQERMKNPFWSFFKDRGINSTTQRAFGDYLLLSKQKEINDANGKPVRTFQNMSFPMRIPGEDSLEDKIVGMEVRGRQKPDGTSYKGMAVGSNASQGAWIASPNHTTLKEAKDVFVFESAYDALAFFQINNRRDNDKYTTKQLYDAVYVSSGGQLGEVLSEGLLRRSQNATFHLGFDNDMAGETFAARFVDVAKRVYNSDDISQSVTIIREKPTGGQKDWNDQLKDEIAAKQTATTSDSVNEDMTKEKTVAAAVDADLDGEIDIATEGDERKTSVKR